MLAEAEAPKPTISSFAIAVFAERAGKVVEAAFEPGVLPRVDLCLTQLALDLFRAQALDRITDDPVQQCPVDLALDQVILRSRPHCLRPEVLIGHARQHDHGQLGHVLGQPAHSPQLL